MTNREKIMAELDALPGDFFYLMLADNKVTQAIDDAMCDTCKAKYGGCISMEDHTPCPFEQSEWLAMPAAGAAILPAP